MALDNFTWRGRKPKYDENTGSYTPGSEGGLSILGQTLSGVGAAFAGDTQWMQRQQQIDQEAMQADMEFRAKLAEQRLRNQEKENSKKQTEAFLKQYGSGLDSTNDTKPFVMQPGVSAEGELYLRPFQNPYFKQDMAIQQEAKKTINQEVPTFNQTLSALDRMDELINQSPDYKPGFLEATAARADVALKEYSNDPFVKKYKGFVNQSLSNLARKLGEKGVLTEQDVNRVVSGLGSMDTSRELRKQLTSEIRQKMADSGIGLLETAGMSKEDFYKKYPDTAKKLFNTDLIQTSKDPRYQAALKAGYKPEEIDAYLKGRK